MRISYWGNFSAASYSTENHVALSLEDLGHTVTRLQEGTIRADDISQLAGNSDLFLWTQTMSLANQGGSPGERLVAITRLHQLGVPTVSFHLDRWWGLTREDQVFNDPYFRTSYVFTADGGHQQEWENIGVNHIWSPPAIHKGEAIIGTPRREYASDILFVGSWRGGYHKEWTHRPALIEHLTEKWGSKVKVQFWPKLHAIRERDLADLYASAKVVVGDSCLVPMVDGSPMTHYWSDRIPETIGRGGFLLHPNVLGLDTQYTPGVHMDIWELWDWDQLDAQIDHYLSHPDARDRIRLAGREHVLNNHTYAHRLARILGHVAEKERAKG